MRVALAALIRERAALLSPFLRSCERLRPEAYYLLVNDSSPGVVATVDAWARDHWTAKVIHRDYGAGVYREHVWSDDTADRAAFTARIAQMRDQLLEAVFSDGYDACFMVDSDVLCHPDAIEHLVASRRDAISLLYLADWGREPRQQLYRVPERNDLDRFINWQLAMGRQPQCRLWPVPHSGPRFLRAHKHFPRDPFERIFSAPGVHRCEMIGAASLFTRCVWESGCRYDRPLGPSGGEDDVFCRQLIKKGISLWASNVLPTWHCDRPEIAADWAKTFG